MSRLFPLVVTGAEARRRGKRLIGPIDLQLDGVGLTMIVGPNGSGKTTLLNLLHGTVRLAAGQVAWQAAMEDVRRLQSFVFQRPVMLRRSVIDNLAYPLIIRGQRKRAARNAAAAWAERIGLAGMEDRRATSLSGGEQQKLALARALISEPQVLYLDEPCAALDGRATREIEALLLEQKTAGTQIIMATHDMGQARRLADQIIFLYDGKVGEIGPADAFFAHPETPQAQAFLKGDIVE